MKPSHIIIVIIVLIIVFGASKLPDIARSLGQSAKVLKKEMRDLSEDEKPAQIPPANNQHYGQENQTWGQQHYQQQPYQQRDQAGFPLNNERRNPNNEPDPQDYQQRPQHQDGPAQEWGQAGQQFGNPHDPLGGPAGGPGGR